MCVWRDISFSHSRWNAMLRLSHALHTVRTPLTSTMATRAARVGQPCEGCGLTFLRWKRLFPVLLRYARRSLRLRPVTTSTSRPPSRYLMFGVVGFLWERERISNEEVMRCLKQYKERVRLQSTSDTQHHSPENKSLHESQQTMGECQQSSLLSSESWSLSNLWSTITFGWFGNTQQNSKENSHERVNEGGVESTSVASSFDETSMSTEVHVLDESEQKRLEFKQEMTDYLCRHTEERKSMLPMVGLSKKGPSRVMFGAKLTHRVKQIKSRVLSHMTEAPMLEFEGQEGLQSDCCGSSIADLACLEMASHDHTCANEADEVGDWFQYKITEFEQNLYSLSSDQSELSYHFYPMIGLQDHNKVANAVNRLASLVQGSPLATVLQTIEGLTHAYDHVLGTDYHLDRNLAAFSHSVKTRWNQILSGVISEMANELRELKEAISSSDSSRYHDTSSSTNLSDSTLKRDKTCTVSEDSHTSIKHSASERSSTESHDRIRGHKRAKQNAKTANKYRTSGLEIDSFHHFGDVHSPRDEVNGPPVSGELGQELLSMLRMARLKVRQERQQGRLAVNGSEVSRVGGTVQSTVEESERSEKATNDVQAQSASLEGWELLAKEKSDTVYRRLYQDTGLYQYKVIGRYHDITARDYLEVQVNHEVRKEWDSYATTLNTVDSDPKSGCELIYWIMKYPFPMSNRDYVFIRKVWISPEEDAIVFISRSVEHPNYPVNSQYTRVDHYFSEMVIKPHSFIDELGFDYEFTYFDNPQLRLSTTIVNWVTTAAMPDFLTKIHQAAASRRRKDQTNFLHSS